MVHQKAIKNNFDAFALCKGNDSCFFVFFAVVSIQSVRFDYFPYHTTATHKEIYYNIILYVQTLFFLFFLFFFGGGGGEGVYEIR